MIYRSLTGVLHLEGKLSFINNKMRAKDILSDNYCKWLYFINTYVHNWVTHDQNQNSALKRKINLKFYLGLWFTDILTQQNFSSNEFQVILLLIARNDSYFSHPPTNSFFLSSWLLCQFQNRVTYIPLIIYCTEESIVKITSPCHLTVRIRKILSLL